MKRWILGTILIVLLLPLHREVAASEVPTRTDGYAILVGSNRPGPGQAELQYADDDARRIKNVLTDLGGFSEANIELLLDPGRQELSVALDEMRDRLGKKEQRGEDTLFLFFYSGHARSQAINLGAEDLKLGELRHKLDSMPATLRVVILDACHTGAISQIKGAYPVKEFSHNSVERLNTEGMVVMASSSADELSQEADYLEGSYFTHHLVVGLRGAADLNKDGRVSLSEAYRYAYNSTLVSTANTKVGKQHVTLETDLRGKGETVLTWPQNDLSGLALSRDLEGEVLIFRPEDNIVVAEIHKAPGDTMKVALPGDDYVVLVRNNSEVNRCQVSLEPASTVQVDGKSCETIDAREYTIKGRPASRRPTRFAAEVGLGALVNFGDNYQKTLNDFGYGLSGNSMANLHYSVMLGLNLHKYLALGIGFANLDSFQAKTDGHTNVEFESPNLDRAGLAWQEGDDRTLKLSSYNVSLSLRGQLPLAGGIIAPFAQVGGGLGWAVTRLENTLPSEESVIEQNHLGYVLQGGVGVEIMPWRQLGMFVQASYLWAPIVENNLGENHNSGGLSATAGLRVAH